MKKIGIIAGNGLFPVHSAESAHKEGYSVCVCAIRGETDPAVEAHVDAIAWFKLGQIKKLTRFFKGYGVRDVIFAGKITKTSLFSGQVHPDIDMLLLMSSLRNRKDDTILGALCAYLEKRGLNVLDSTTFLKHAMPSAGVLTKHKPSRTEHEDIVFGWELAKELGRLDIGQSVVVKNKAILAAEAIEGTDEAIRRGGALGNGKVVVVKVAKPNQDMRFDVPTIGPRTIAAMIDADARVLAFEADKTLCIDLDDMIARADRAGIVITAIA